MCAWKAVQHQLPMMESWDTSVRQDFSARLAQPMRKPAQWALTSQVKVKTTVRSVLLGLCVLKPT